MSKSIWIDDIRDPKMYRGHFNIPQDVIWLKTYEDAKSFILSNNDITWVGFDNDLGGDKDKQGRHLFNLLEERFVNGENPHFIAVFQTSNTPAHKEMSLAYARMNQRSRMLLNTEGDK